MINENQAPVNCDICLKVLKGPEQLKIHIGTVHEEKTLCCEVCPKSEKRYSKIEMRLHKMSHREKKVQCDQCESRFRSGYSLKVHFSRVHLKNKQYICSFTGCDKGFFVPRELVYHERIHTGEKPYDCKVCLRTFRKSSQLIRHKKLQDPFELFGLLYIP